MKKTTRTLLGIGGAFCLIGALLFWNRIYQWRHKVRSCHKLKFHERTGR